MTSEYDKLLARIEDAKVECARLTKERDSAVAQAATASAHSADTRRAWIADSKRLTDSRDLMYESRQQERAKVRVLTAQVLERDAVIEQAPHAEDCDQTASPYVRGFVRVRKCTCWKSQTPRDALAARDAVRDKTVRATALRDAAEDVYAEPGIWDKGYAPWLRARADQEEGK